MSNYDLNINEIKLVFFFERLQVKSLLQIANSCSVAFADSVQQPPQIMPIAENMPEDIPWFIINDTNINIIVTLNTLRLQFNVVSDSDYEKTTRYYYKKIKNILEHFPSINRIGFVVDGMSNVDLSDRMSQYISMKEFNTAKEANISWLQDVDNFNVWTVLKIDKNIGINNVIFDINSKESMDISKLYNNVDDMLDKCFDILKGFM